MDTSETYIKMCNCPEIQDSHDWSYGWETYVRARRNPFWGTNGDWYYDLDGNVIWLPTQDQLQEMVFDSRITAIVISHELSNYALTIPKVKIGKDMKAYPKLSMEQLWLAFVMKEKFGKVWDKENWVNANL